MDSIILADGQSTPVNHTFTPTQTTPVAVWTEKLGVPIGEPYVTLSYSPSNQKRRTNRVKATVNVPVLKAVTGSVDGYAPSPAISHTSLGTIEVVTSDRSTAAQRADILAFLKGFVNSDEFEALVANGTRP